MNRILANYLIKKGPKQSTVPLKCIRRFSLHTLSQENVALKNLVKKYCDANLKPIASQLDKTNCFPLKQIQELGDLGLLGINVDAKWGGSGLSMLALAIGVEEISKACGGTGSIVSIHNCLYANLLDRCGNEQQKEVFLKPFTKGDLGCFALSESEAGSDVSNITTTATICGDNYVLNGAKAWVTSGIEAKAAVVFATIDKELQHRGVTAFLVPLPSKGVTLGKKDDKLGIKAASSCTMMLDDVIVHKENVLGNTGDGFKIAMEQLDYARVGIAAQAIGIGQAALDVAVEYASKRIIFGKPINELQAVKLRIAEMALKLESARLLVWRAAVLCDEPERSTKESSMAKLAASEAATFISHNSIQILGGMGYVTDMPAERHYRDARITEIYGGVTDIQKLIIADLVIKDYE